MTHPVATEYEYEPIPGLPGSLPEGERILWQGRPVARSVARHVMKTRWLLGYFALLTLWTVSTGYYDGQSVGAILFSVAFMALLGLVPIGLCMLYAWGVQKTSLYTITNHRIVMRIGVALSVTLNVPFRQIEAANRIDFGDGTGSVTVALKEEQRFAWLVLWPHLRPWCFARPEPSLRCIADVDGAVQALLEHLPHHADASATEEAGRDIPSHPDLVTG